MYSKETKPEDNSYIQKRRNLQTTAVFKGNGDSCIQWRRSLKERKLLTTAVFKGENACSLQLYSEGKNPAAYRCIQRGKRLLTTAVFKGEKSC